MDLSEYADWIASRPSATVVVCGAEFEAGAVARGLASQFDRPARLFEVVGDELSREHAGLLGAALAGREPVVLYGAADSDLLGRLTHVWPDYVEHAQNTTVTITRHLTLTPASDAGAPPAIFVVVHKMGERFDRCRPQIFRLGTGEAAKLAAAGQHNPAECTILGRRVSREISMRALCLMHHWDPEGTPLARSIAELLKWPADALNWADLASLLRPDPNLELLEHFRDRGRISDDQYAFVRAAANFLREWKVLREWKGIGPVYPDVYSAVWYMEPIIGDAIFRGQYSAAWGLATTLMRSGPCGLDVDELADRLERTRAFVDMLQTRSDELFGCILSDDELLAVAQHFGFPTPLLDYTRSLRIAAFFATVDAAKGSAPGAADEIGVVYHMSRAPEEVFPTATGSGDLPPLTALSGVRLGSLRVIEPRLPNDENRIARQQGVFIAGYRPRDAAAYIVDRIYFRQQPGVVFEDPRTGITSLDLMPDDARVAQLAAKFRENWKCRSSFGPTLGGTRLDESSIVGSSANDLYWQLNSGQQLLNNMFEMAREIDPSAAGRLTKVVTGYFAGVRMLADVAEAPHGVAQGDAVDPLFDAVADLEVIAGLDAGAIWKRLRPYVRRNAQGFLLDLKPEAAWPERARLALGCALFLAGWEHLREVDAERARELVQTAKLAITAI